MCTGWKAAWKIREGKEEIEKPLDSTDAIVDSIIELIEEFIDFFKNEIDNYNISEGRKIVL